MTFEHFKGFYCCFIALKNEFYLLGGRVAEFPHKYTWLTCSPYEEKIKMSSIYTIPNWVRNSLRTSLINTWKTEGAFSSPKKTPAMAGDVSGTPTSELLWHTWNQTAAKAKSSSGKWITEGTSMPYNFKHVSCKDFHASKKVYFISFYSMAMKRNNVMSKVKVKMYFKELMRGIRLFGHWMQATEAFHEGFWGIWPLSISIPLLKHTFNIATAPPLNWTPQSPISYMPWAPICHHDKKKNCGHP